MRTVIIPAAVIGWIAGIIVIVTLGWTPDPPIWRTILAASSGAVVLAGIVVALWHKKPEANVAALVASLGIAIALPAPVDRMGTLVGFAAATAVILTAYFTLQLSLRTHAVTGDVLKHGATRIAGTIGLAALATLLLVAGLRTATGAASARWKDSIDVGSGQFLVAITVLLLAVATGASLLMVARNHTDMGNATENPSTPDEPEGDASA